MRTLEKGRGGASALGVQWLRRLASIIGGTGLITGQKTKIPHETVKKINR